MQLGHTKTSEALKKPLIVKTLFKIQKTLATFLKNRTNLP